MLYIFLFVRQKSGKNDTKVVAAHPAEGVKINAGGAALISNLLIGSTWDSV